jgi:hypothetical protein
MCEGLLTEAESGWFLRHLAMYRSFYAFDKLLGNSSLVDENRGSEARFREQIPLPFWGRRFLLAT